MFGSMGTDWYKAVLEENDSYIQGPIWVYSWKRKLGGYIPHKWCKGFRWEKVNKHIVFYNLVEWLRFCEA